MTRREEELRLRLLRAAHGSSVLAHAAANLLEVIREDLTTIGATVIINDPVAERHRVVCAFGFEGAILDHLGSRNFLERDVGYQLLREQPGRIAASWRDIEGYDLSSSAVNVFKPAGLRGGTSVRLITRDGRYTGDLHIGTTDPELPDGASVESLRQTAPLIADAMDVTRRLGAMLPDPGDGDDVPSAAVVTTRAKVVAIPGRRCPALFTVDPTVTGCVAAWRRKHVVHGLPAGFYHHTGTAWWRIKLTPVAAGTLVESLEQSPPYPLTLRGLEVLTLLSEGTHNVGIARRLNISERTCAHHVEALMSKLNVPSRSAATARAWTEGLRLLSTSELHGC